MLGNRAGVWSVGQYASWQGATRAHAHVPYQKLWMALAILVAV